MKAINQNQMTKGNHMFAVKHMYFLIIFRECYWFYYETVNKKVIKVYKDISNNNINEILLIYIINLLITIIKNIIINYFLYY